MLCWKKWSGCKSSNGIQNVFPDGVNCLLKTFAYFKEFANQNEKLRVLTPEDIAHIQQALLEMMDDFDALCRRNGLCYFLTGGSALGAVRHQGFIPWDEDMDIIMPRADYDRLTECVDRELGDRYWVQGMKTSPVCDLNFLKVRKKGTKYVELFENEPERAGLFLDVFPLEDMYDNGLVRFVNGVLDEGLFFIASCVRIYNKRERLAQYVQGSKLEGAIRLKIALGRLFSSKKDPYKWFKRCEVWQSKCKNPTSKYMTVSCGRGHYFGETYERDKIFPVQEVPFAGRRYFMPKDSDYLLRVLYGPDYMTPADPNHREMHSVVELDLGEHPSEREKE